MCILFNLAQYFISSGRVAIAAHADEEVGPCAACGQQGRWLPRAEAADEDGGCPASLAEDKEVSRRLLAPGRQGVWPR